MIVWGWASIAQKTSVDEIHASAVAQAVPVRALGLAAYDPAGDPSRRGAQFGIDMALEVVESARL